ncbi:hypothetical protein TorRG33x02_315690 [Trema orientale]|uniref:Uncharacterized protein n=1 Tax=Trema orientale TaxID=63057 RepID=A0A2P5BMY0_TREOI|nr:hypothetical protein TorRG33x02_315690 [Trema orientale]
MGSMESLKGLGTHDVGTGNGQSSKAVVHGPPRVHYNLTAINVNLNQVTQEVLQTSFKPVNARLTWSEKEAVKPNPNSRLDPLEESRFKSLKRKLDSRCFQVEAQIQRKVRPKNVTETEAQRAKDLFEASHLSSQFKKNELNPIIDLSNTLSVGLEPKSLTMVKKAARGQNYGQMTEASMQKQRENVKEKASRSRENVEFDANDPGIQMAEEAGLTMPPTQP